jgi:hypothetical protein
MNSSGNRARPPPQLSRWTNLEPSRKLATSSSKSAWIACLPKAGVWFGAITSPKVNRFWKLAESFPSSSAFRARTCLRAQCASEKL